MEKLAIVILAAGLGKRMKSDLPKVVAKTREKTLILHVLETAGKLLPEKLVVVTGFKRSLVEDEIKKGASQAGVVYENVSIAEQTAQRGTGDAAKAAVPFLQGFSGTVLILYGDVPLLRVDTLQGVLMRHHKDKATVTLLSAHHSNPKSYGRIVRNEKSGQVERIVEAKDCSPQELLIHECNTGICAVDSAFFAPSLESLKSENAQGEYYLTDIVEKAHKEGQIVSSVVADDPLETEGVNTLSDLAQVNQVLLNRSRTALLNSGVMMEDPDSVFIDPLSTVAPGASIGPNVQIRGKCCIESGVVIEGSAYLNNTIVKEGARLKFSVRADEAIIGKNAQIGPFAHLRPGTELSEDVHVGNFVETKKAFLAPGVKASHLTYLGDCKVGARTNIGAGTITCNYDGYKKYETIIGEGVFVGSDTCFVAPVNVGDGATIGAGSVITKNVAKDSLALTRGPLRTKPEWSRMKRELNKKTK